MAAPIEITVAQLEPGDRVLSSPGQLAYTVVEDIRRAPDELIVRVQWIDGGVEPRAWDGDLLAQVVLVERGEAS